MKKLLILPIILMFNYFGTYSQHLQIINTSVAGEPDAPNVAGVAAAKHIALSQVNNYVGKTITVCGKIFDSKLLKNIVNKPTLMNMGSEFANDRLEVRINFNNLANFNYNPEKLFINKNLCITGTILNKYGFVEIEMDSLQGMQLLNEAKAMPADPYKNQSAKKIKLARNAYLFAGPDLNEPIITHLKPGSVLVAEHSYYGWTYATILQKADTETKPEYLAGFIRNWALRLK